MTNHSNRFKVAFSVTNCICFDQRVLKMAGTVRNLGCEITIIGRKRGECCDADIVPFKTKRFRMLFNKGILFYKFFNIRLFIYLLFNKFDILVANDLDTLLPNYLVSRLKHLPLVYDSHEYFTGVPELNGRPFVRRVWKSIEKCIFPKLQNVITVCDSIADQYESEYKVRAQVIRNCAESSDAIHPYNRKDLGSESKDLIIIFQGSGINIDRGGEELIEAVRQIENTTLLIVGSGDVYDLLKAKMNEIDPKGKVKFIPKIPWKELIRYTKLADVGISIDKDTCLNYRFSLPNKLFDYISAGIPVITGNLPEICKIVESYQCGIIIPEITPEEISGAIRKLMNDPVLLNKLRMNSVSASKTLNWENESSKVKELYLDILKNIG